MRKSIAIMVSVLLVICFVGIGYGADVKKGIRVGNAGAFTGDAAAPCAEIYNSAQIAIDEWNAKGGIQGVKIEQIMGDDAMDPAQGVNVAEKFCSDKKIYGVIGPAMSDIAAATLRIYNSCGLAQISSSASADNLTEKGYNTFFRVCARNDAHGPAVARFIVAGLKAKKVYLLNPKDTYSQGLADQVAKTLEAAGVTVVRSPAEMGSGMQTAMKG